MTLQYIYKDSTFDDWRSKNNSTAKSLGDVENKKTNSSRNASQNELEWFNGVNHDVVTGATSLVVANGTTATITLAHGAHKLRPGMHVYAVIGANVITETNCTIASISYTSTNAVITTSHAFMSDGTATFTFTPSASSHLNDLEFMKVNRTGDTIRGDLIIDGNAAASTTGTLGTNETTFNLINANATTVNAFGTAQAIVIGSDSNTALTTIRTDLKVNGDALSTDEATFSLLDTPTTVTAFNAGTNITIGANLSGDLTLRNTTTNVTGTLQVTTGDITTTDTVGASLFNTNALVLSMGGEATTVSIGAASGTTTINNNATVSLDLTVNGGDVTIGGTPVIAASTVGNAVSLFNTSTGTINFGGAAATVNISKVGATTAINGTTSINGTTTVNGNTTVSGSYTFATTTGAATFGGTATFSAAATFNSSADFNGVVTIDGANVNTTIAPTGTGTVTINPSGALSLSTLNKTSANSTDITIATGTTTTSGNSGSLSLSTGTAVGTSGNITVDVGSAGTKGNINLGTANASNITIGKSSNVVTKINGLTISGSTGTLTLANSIFTTLGNYNISLTATAVTTLTLPATGTLATLAGTETLTNKTLTAPTINGGEINNASVGATTASTVNATKIGINSTTTTNIVETYAFELTGNTATTPVDLFSTPFARAGYRSAEVTIQATRNSGGYAGILGEFYVTKFLILHDDTIANDDGMPGKIYETEFGSIGNMVDVPEFDSILDATNWNIQVKQHIAAATTYKVLVTVIKS